MVNSNIQKIQKLNQYFYMTPQGNILKYKNIVLLLIVKKLHLLIILGKKKCYIVMNINTKLW